MIRPCCLHSFQWVRLFRVNRLQGFLLSLIILVYNNLSLTLNLSLTIEFDLYNNLSLTFQLSLTIIFSLTIEFDLYNNLSLTYILSLTLVLSLTIGLGKLILLLQSLINDFGWSEFRSLFELSSKLEHFIVVLYVNPKIEFRRDSRLCSETL